MLPVRATSGAGGVVKVRTWGRPALAVVAVGAVFAALLAFNAERTRWQERHSVELGIAIIERDEAREYANGLAVRLTEAERQRDAARAELAATPPVVCADGAADAWEAVYRVCDDDSCGTAFHIGGGRWLTAAHVVEGGGALVLDDLGIGWDGYPATLHWRNPDYAPPADGPTPDRMNRSDYAVLQSDHAPAASIRLADAPPPDGQRLTIVGWTGGVKRELAVRAERTGALDRWGAVDLDGGLGHGSSGAPAIDECGVAYAMIAAGDGGYSVGPAVHQMDGLHQLQRDIEWSLTWP